MTGKHIQTVLGSLFFTICYIYMISKKMKDIKDIQMTHDDEIIKGKVIGRKPFLLTGDIHPIVLCNINGSKVTYTYRYIYSEKKYAIGTDVELRVSKISGLPYDKNDLMRDLTMNFAFLFLCIFGMGVGLYVIMFIH